MSAIVAIIGRPNVGKSSLFNRLIKKKHAIESDIAGTTRDRIFMHTKIEGKSCLLVDTAGLEFHSTGEIEKNVQQQAKIAMDDAHVIIFVVNGREPLTATDIDTAHILRKQKKKVIFVANKCDHPKIDDQLSDFLKLGLGVALPISAMENRGVDCLEEMIGALLPEEKVPHTQKSIHIALVGRPNVGKSSLLNAIAGYERSVVSDIPGTTRDAIDTDVVFDDQTYVLIDTAGLRRKGKIERGIEYWSGLRTLAAIERSDIAVLLIDASEGPTKQDAHIAEAILESKKGVIIAVNKTDLLPEEDRDAMDTALMGTLGFMPWAPVVYISAKTKLNIWYLFKQAYNIMQERLKEISGPDLRQTILDILYHKPPPSSHGKRIMITSGLQMGINPPTFALKTNHPDNVHFSYKRYIENSLRKKYGFGGTPIVICFVDKFLQAVPEKRKRPSHGDHVHEI